MIRLGIIGTENSHAMAFSKILNLPDPSTGRLRHPDVKVVGVYGPEPDSAQAIVDQAGAEFLAKDPAEFFGKVDAMLITCRKGSLHSGYAMPFVEKGMPLFIDKPFTSDLREAEALAAAAKDSGSKLCGGSGCRYAYDVLLLQNQVRMLREEGQLIGGAMSYPADPDSEYDGFYFYAPHLVEMALAVFGSQVRSILTRERGGSRVSLWRYDDCDVSLHFTKDSWDSTAVVYGKKGNVVRGVDTSMIYVHEVDHLVNMLKTGEMPSSYEELVTPVRMISAVEESVRTGREIFL